LVLHCQRRQENVPRLRASGGPEEDEIEQINAEAYAEQVEAALHPDSDEELARGLHQWHPYNDDENNNTNDDEDTQNSNNDDDIYDTIYDVNDDMASQVSND
jgi:hypothetical protein